MDEGFKVFSRYHTHSTKVLLITIQKGGTNITLNRAAYLALGSPPGVLLGYHEDSQYIGFLPADQQKICGTPVNKQGGSESYYIAGKAFTHEFDIDTSIARRYRAVYDDGMLKIFLNQASSIATGPREKNNGVSLTQQRLLDGEREQKERNVNLSAEIVGIEQELTNLLRKAHQQGISNEKIAKYLFAQKTS